MKNEKLKRLIHEATATAPFSACSCFKQCNCKKRCNKFTPSADWLVETARNLKGAGNE
jgi:hypothetical protein